LSSCSDTEKREDHTEIFVYGRFSFAVTNLTSEFK
jgi:hypothetical protein